MRSPAFPIPQAGDRGAGGRRRAGEGSLGPILKNRQEPGTDSKRGGGSLLLVALAYHGTMTPAESGSGSSCSTGIRDRARRKGSLLHSVLALACCSLASMAEMAESSAWSPESNPALPEATAEIVDFGNMGVRYARRGETPPRLFPSQVLPLLMSLPLDTAVGPVPTCCPGVCVCERERTWLNSNAQWNIPFGRF